MIYADLHASILRYCSDKAQTWENPPRVMNFDAAADENMLPKEDMIGPLALTFEVDNGTVEGHVQIGYSSYDDTNLFRLISRMDDIIQDFIPGSHLEVYKSTDPSSYPVGKMAIAGPLRLLPVVINKVHPIQFVMIHFVTTQTYRLDLLNPQP